MKALMLGLTWWRVEGKEKVPRQGPLLVVANHLNIIDPPLLSASVPRRIMFLAKKELFNPRTPGSLFVRAFGAFPVRRGELDRRALKWSLQVLRDGGALGMFPEGTRSPNAQLTPAFPGSALIALRSGAPILPVAISGSEKVNSLVNILRRPRVKVTIGEPFSLPRVEGRVSKAELARAAEFIMRQIAQLLPPSYRGVYGNSG